MNELTPEKIIDKLRQTIVKGKYGKDYTIIPRDKNNLLRERYILDDEKIKTILLSLTIDDYIITEDSDNEKHIDDVIHIFRKKTGLIPRYSKKIELIPVELYIKFTWTKSDLGYLIIISFHEWNIR